MKKIFYFVLGVAVCVSCTNEPDVVSPAAGSRSLRFTLSDVEMESVSDDSSRVTFGENFVINWEDAKDALGVFVYNPETNAMSTKGVQASIGRDDDGVATVAATVSEFQSGDQLVAYYPYTRSNENFQSVKMEINANQTQYGLGNFNGVYIPMVSVPVTLDAAASEVGETVKFRQLGSVVEWGVYSSDETFRSENVESVSFTATNKDAGGIVFLNLKDTSETEDINVSASGSKSVTVSLMGDAPVPAAATPDQSVYAVLAPNAYTGCTVVVTTDKATYTWSVDEFNAPRAYVRRIGLDLASENAVREARTETEAVDLSAAGTANTYYVSQPATTYKFKATVKGNGEAFTGSNISYTAEDLAIDPACALLVWYNSVQSNYQPWAQLSPVEINSVELGDDGYVYFRTPAAFVNGNVLIAVFDAPVDYQSVELNDKRQITNANLLWSWNIVAAEGYDLDATAVTKGGYTFMNRDLGAVIDPEDAANDIEKASTVGNFYQYGRKDPFPSIPDFTSVQICYMTGLTFTPTYTPIVALDQGSFGRADYARVAHHQILGNTGETIAVKLYENRGDVTAADAVAAAAAVPYAWMQEYDWGHWMANDGGEAWSTTAKTIYDPCPAGWRMMTEEAWNALIGDATAHADLDAGKGFRFDAEELRGAYFPINTMRGGNGYGNDYSGSCGLPCYSSYAVAGHADYENTRVVRAEFKANYATTEVQATGEDGKPVVDEEGKPVMVPVDNTDITFKAENRGNSWGFCVRCIRETVTE